MVLKCHKIKCWSRFMKSTFVFLSLTLFLKIRKGTGFWNSWDFWDYSQLFYCKVLYYVLNQSFLNLGRTLLKVGKLTNLNTAFKSYKKEIKVLQNVGLLLEEMSWDGIMTYVLKNILNLIENHKIMTVSTMWRPWDCWFWRKGFNIIRF